MTEHALLNQHLLDLDELVAMIKLDVASLKEGNKSGSVEARKRLSIVGKLSTTIRAECLAVVKSKHVGTAVTPDSKTPESEPEKAPENTPEIGAELMPESAPLQSLLSVSNIEREHEKHDNTIQLVESPVAVAPQKENIPKLKAKPKSRVVRATKSSSRKKINFQ